MNKVVSKHFKTLVVFLVLQLFFINTTLGQCPTINDPNPSICDTNSFQVIDLNTYTTDSGSGIVWYEMPTGGLAIANDDLVEDGKTYYAGDFSGSCGTRPGIAINFEFDLPSSNLDDIRCTNENNTIQNYFDEIVFPTITAGIIAEIFTDLELTMPADPTAILQLGGTNLFVRYTNTATGCYSQTLPAQIGVFPSPEDPTPESPQKFCGETTIADLDPGTTEEHNWYASLDPDGEVILPALPLSQILVDGATYYVRAEDFFCDSNPAPVTVTIYDLVDPGESSDLNLCENTTTGNITLIDELGGTPESGGTWTTTTGISITGGDQGIIDITGITIGTYIFTYTVLASVTECSDATATVTITVFEPLSAGMPSANNPQAFCLSALPSDFDLLTLIEGQDPDGQWTEGTTSTGTPITTPVDLITYTVGTYNFTYTQNLAPNPCPEQSTTVQIVISSDPNVGTAVNASFCINDLMANSPYNLFLALDGTQDNNSGTWTDASGTTVTNPIDITGFTVVDSPYTFTYSIDNSGCIKSEDITITIEDAPESGTPEAPVSFCIASAPMSYDLFDLLANEDQTGVWFEGATNTPGNEIVNPIDLTTYVAGSYTFTYDVDNVGACDDELVSVQIIIESTNGPTGDSIQNFCDSATVADLVANGTAIQWYDDLTSTTPLDPTTELINGEDYFATQSSATCQSDIRLEVMVNLFDSPNSGTVLPDALTYCSTNSVIDLNLTLDGTQDTGGIWSETVTSGTLSGSIFDATMVGIGSYDFIYTVLGTAPCVNASTPVTITIAEPLSPGENSTLTICNRNDGTTYDLFLELGGTPSVGGTWSPALTSGTSVFDPAIDPEGDYTYTVVSACDNEPIIAIVSVNVTDAPNAGEDSSPTFCLIDGVIDLIPILGTNVSVGGTWSPALANGSNIFDTAVDIAGTYTYTVTATTPCIDSDTDSATLIITINDSAPPLVVNSTASYCKENLPTVSDLDENVTGTAIKWYAQETDTTPLDPTIALENNEDYYATQTGASNCESSTRVRVDVIINDADTPELTGDNEFCIIDEPTLLELSQDIEEYDASATPSIITWYDAPTGGNILPVSTEMVINTTYYASLTDPITNCRSSERLAVTPNLTACGNVIVPDGFSPNADGTNDTLDIDGLDLLFPNFEMEIYNRYGNIVYKGNVGTPRFDGTSNQSRLVSKGDLPVGVYYYILNLNDNSTKPLEGSIYLNR